jgi:hypothetical protein
VSWRGYDPPLPHVRLRPAPGVVRWVCTACPRVVDQTQAGAILVRVAGVESVDHAGRAGLHHIFDQPEAGAFELAGPMGRFLEGL